MKTKKEIQELYDYLKNTRNEMNLDNTAVTSIMGIESEISILAWVLDINLSSAETKIYKEEEH